MNHSDPPDRTGAAPPEVQAAMTRILASQYCEDVHDLLAGIWGKIVDDSRAGRGGYILFFAERIWVAAVVRDECLVGATGRGDPPPSILEAIEGHECGDPAEPVGPEVPYGDEPCDLSREVAQCHGQPVVGSAIGENTFNLCFPGGMELDAHISRDHLGRPRLRVFWEQW